jgi:hypothetical protein
VTLRDDLAIDVVPLGACPRAQVKPKVRIRPDDVDGLAWCEPSQLAVDEEVATAIEAEAVKVDNRRR